ncbi:hypothetical protein GCM10010967_01010 [Dyadobacter beijingensis]|uniref:DUF3188 domain-containing protein n=1 Tax=Dyadobacter beijingensis TaxID=365489 RepID=A0ABQ2HAK9_9BACT|nr:hypothetical protein [Dyadobacter beijingensis]GGM73228.1 hypothetical protein GCM10010967_01010 [Dyadobacter beijingensis]
MKLNLRNAVLILLAGMIVLATGSFLNSSKTQFSDPVILSGLAIEFLGTIWLVLSLNQRRRRKA